MEKPIASKQFPESSTDNPPVWDCGSSLYDSFERRAFQKHLDSAISSRTLSMPHLSTGRKTASRVSRSFQKVVRAVFRFKGYSCVEADVVMGVRVYGIHDNRSGRALSTIPEGPEFDGRLPDRFTAACSRGISCSSD